MKRSPAGVPRSGRVISRSLPARGVIFKPNRLFCARRRDASLARTIRLQSDSNAHDRPWRVALEQGFFADEGLDVAYHEDNPKGAEGRVKELRLATGSSPVRAEKPARRRKLTSACRSLTPTLSRRGVSPFGGRRASCGRAASSRGGGARQPTAGMRKATPRPRSSGRARGRWRETSGSQGARRESSSVT